MDKLEKVIKGIDICLSEFNCENACPYKQEDSEDCVKQLKDDALGLLTEYKNKAPLIQWLLQLNENELSLAIVYAQNYIKTGEDVTQKWETAIQNASALARAERIGYMTCIRELCRTTKDGEQE